MNDEFVHPILHAVLAVVALAALACGLLSELLCMAVRRPVLRSAARWMMLGGALACLPAAATGVHAHLDLVRDAAGDAAPGPGAYAWYQLARQATPHLPPQRWAEMERHGWWMARGAVLVMIAAAFVFRAGGGGRGRGYWTWLSVAIAATAWMGVGAWNSFRAHRPADGGDDFAIDPLQLHVALGGMMAAAVALATVMGGGRVAQPPEREESNEAPPAGQPARAAARLWILAIAIALGTTVAGAWVAGVYGNWERVTAVLAQPRDLVHATLGAAIIALAMVMAVLARRPRRRTWAVRATGALLASALALEVASGTLMLYDGSDRGASVWRLRPPTVQRPTTVDSD